MDIVFRPSAFRHGISQERIRHVVAHCSGPIYPPAGATVGPDVVLFLGPDQHGNDLEIAGLDIGDGRVRVIHAMPMRAKYRAQYQRLMGWPKRSP